MLFRWFLCCLCLICFRSSFVVCVCFGRIRPYLRVHVLHACVVGIVVCALCVQCLCDVDTMFVFHASVLNCLNAVLVCVVLVVLNLVCCASGVLFVCLRGVIGWPSVWLSCSEVVEPVSFFVVLHGVLEHNY